MKYLNVPLSQVICISDTHYNSTSMQNIPLEMKSNLSGPNVDFKSSKSSLTSSPPRIKQKPSCCSKVAMVIFRVFYWIFYILIHLLFILFFVLTAYFPCTVIRDVDTYRSTADMYTVRIPKHKPIALHMKCTGTGPETILYENCLGCKNYSFLSTDFACI